MIALRRLNNSDFVLNAEFIESLEATPDTVVTLSNGKKLVVLDSVEEIVRKVITYKQMCLQSVTVLHRDSSTAHNREER
jgi:flagellar protein FlbD